MTTLEVYGCDAAIYLKAEHGGEKYLLRDERLGETTGYYIENQSGERISRYYKTYNGARKCAEEKIRQTRIEGVKLLLVEYAC